MSLRRLRWWDVEVVAALEPELFPAAPWSPEAFWAELALGRSRHYLVAEEPAGVVAGYAGLACPDPARGADAEVMTVAVVPSARGAGLGRRLLDALVDEAVTRGAGRVVLEVRADNAAARALYDRAGFLEVAVRPAYYAPGPVGGPAVDAQVLARRLESVAAAEGSR